MEQLISQDVKKIQLDILQEFHAFCITHDLKYSLSSGTLLGAIRHKGYIPWDDDIDVMMPRRDYQRFLEIFISDKYSLYHYTKKKNYMIPYAKLCDNRTFVIEGIEYESGYGVDIDIFPLDFFPDDIEESIRWSKHLGYFRDIYNVKNIKFSKNRSITKNIILAFFKFLAFPIPMKWLVRRVDVVAQKYVNKSNGFLGNMTGGYRMKERNPMALSLIDVEFEGSFYKAIDNYDVYLRGLYGDYMQLPPKEKRVTHHAYKAYWKSKQL